MNLPINLQDMPCDRRRQRGGLTERRLTGSVPKPQARPCNPGCGSARCSPLAALRPVGRTERGCSELWAPSWKGDREPALLIARRREAVFLAQFPVTDSSSVPSPSGRGRSEPGRGPLRSALSRRPSPRAAPPRCIVGDVVPRVEPPRGAAARADYSSQRAARRRAGRSFE